SRLRGKGIRNVNDGSSGGAASRNGGAGPGDVQHQQGKQKGKQRFFLCYHGVVCYLIVDFEREKRDSKRKTLIGGISMPQYKAPLRDFAFVLQEYLGVSNFQDVPGFSAAGE